MTTSGQRAVRAATKTIRPVVATTARQCALETVQAVTARHQPLDEAFDQAIAGARLEPRDRAFARMLATTTLRHLGEIDAILKKCLDRPLPAKAARARDILRLGAAQLLFLGSADHAAVSTAVDLADADSNPAVRALKGLVNAVLRRLGREGEALRADVDIRLNAPRWLWQSWVDRFGEPVARAIAAGHRAEPPLDIRLRPDLDPADWAVRLGADCLPGGTLRRRRDSGGGRIEDLPGFAEAAWWVQDAAAALPAALLGDVAGQTVLDLCAAPGGKTAQLAAAGARVVAVDQSAARLGRLRENLDRLHLSAEIVTADLRHWTPAGPASHILLDAPCTATGTIRRHPDAQILKNPRDVEKLAALQALLLRRAVGWLAPGGTLIYCVCSLQAAEGPDQIEAFLAETPGFRRRAITPAELPGLADAITPTGDVQTHPGLWLDLGGMDGFFIARLEKI